MNDSPKATARLAEQFPCPTAWPVVPPDEHWLKRWHWLRDGDAFYLADWHHRHGWHWGHSGKPDPEDMDGWTYVEPVQTPSEPPR